MRLSAMGTAPQALGLALQITQEGAFHVAF